MKSLVYPLKLNAQDRRLFRQAAKAEKKPLSQFLRDAARERAGNLKVKARAACLDYTDKVELSEEAERDPRAFIRSRLKRAA